MFVCLPSKNRSATVYEDDPTTYENDSGIPITEIYNVI
jgi:hypothetical protein